MRELPGILCHPNFITRFGKTGSQRSWRRKDLKSWCFNLFKLFSGDDTPNSSKFALIPKNGYSDYNGANPRKAYVEVDKGYFITQIHNLVSGTLLKCALWYYLCNMTAIKSVLFNRLQFVYCNKQATNLFQANRGRKGIKSCSCLPKWIYYCFSQRRNWSR